MALPKFHPRRWLNTLKFKIVAIAVATGVVSAVATANLLLSTTQAGIERLLLSNHADDSRDDAEMLSDKLELLKAAIVAVAQKAGRDAWLDRDTMARFLNDKPALNALFDSVSAIRPDGEPLLRLERGVVRADLPNLGQREYFQRALKTDQPVVSLPLIGRGSGVPIIVIAMPAFAEGGAVAGVILGSLRLQSNRLFATLASARQAHATRTVVMDRSGTLLGHPDASRVMGRAADEPGLADVFARWHGSGSPIDTTANAVLSDGYLVSMTGIPLSDWALVRMTPQAAALDPLAATRADAWRVTAGVGLLSGVVAGLLAWAMTRPITQLRERAEKLLGGIDSTEGWPMQRGEVGELAAAFHHVVEQREQRQRGVQAMLLQLEAVLDHAEVGIAFTRDGYFELVSKQLCGVLGWHKDEIVGQSTRRIYASDAAYEELSARARPAFMEHGAFNGEVELVRRSGAVFWAQMRGRAVVPGDRAQGTIWIIEDVTAEREKREQLTWASSHDALTRLANRPAFETALQHATARAAPEPFCALFIDLDRFKFVNDTAGHAAGDAMLRLVAQELAASVRSSDLVARLGGDEFAVLLSRCPPTQALAIAEKLRKAVMGCELVWEGRTFFVGASIGLVAVDATYADAAAVLEAADAACYAAKRQGRDRVAVHGAVASQALAGPAPMPAPDGRVKLKVV